MVIGIDVDNVVADVIFKWHMWLLDHGYTINPDMAEPEGTTECNYDITSYYTAPEGYPPKYALNFWKQPDLYDDVEMFLDAETVINSWIKEGHKVVFISACFKNHYLSKLNMLRRSVPKATLLNTYDKSIVRCGVLIDDRIEHLNQMPRTTERVLFRTKYRQTVRTTRPCLALDNWDQAGSLFK